MDELEGTGSAGPIPVVWLVLSLLAVVASAWLGRRLWNRRGTMSPKRRLLASSVAVAVVFGAIGMFLGLIKLFGAAGGVGVDPSQQARLLAEGISGAISWIAFSLLVWGPSVVLAFVLARAETPPHSSN